MADIFEAVQPLHIISRLCVVTPFSIKKDKGQWIAKVNIYHILSMLIMTTWITASNVLFIMNRKKMFRFAGVNVSEVVEVTITLTFSIFHASVQLIMLSTFFSRHSIIKCLNVIVNVDKELESHGLTIDHKKHKKFIMTCIVLLECFIVLTILASLYSSKEFSSFALNGYILCTTIVTIHFTLILYLQFILIMWTIKARYRKVNRFLCECFTNKYYDDSAKLNNLNKAAKLHDMLVNACECVNAGYGISVSILCHVLFIIIYSFFFLFSLSLKGNVDDFKLILLHHLDNIYSC